MKTISKIILLAALLTLCIPCSKALASDLLSDEWMEMYFLGTKLGNLHVTTIKTQYNGKPSFMTQSVESTFGIRGNTDFSTEVSLIEYEDENMNPLFIIMNMRISKAKTLMTCDFSGDKIIKIKVSTSESSYEKEQDKSDDILLSWGMSQKMLSKGLKPGTSYAYKAFFPEKFGFLVIKTKVIGKELVDIAGKTLNLNKLRTDVEEMKLTKFDYIDNSGVCYLSEIPAVGMKFIKVAEKDISKNDKSASFELTDLFIKPTGKLENFSNVYESKKAKMTISSDTHDLKEFLTSSNRQELKTQDPKHATLIIYSTKDKNPKIKLKRPFDKSEFTKVSDTDSKKNDNLQKFDFEPYLTDSPFIQCKNEKIRNKAKQIVSFKKDIFECAKLLCQWVNQNLKNKNYSVIYASALEVLENIEGDCSEHTLLFIALARSIGIPARGVLGLVYSEKDKAFGFHVWGEVFGGEWFEMDPTFGFDYVTPAHISVVKTDMNDLSFSGDAVKLIQMIKDFHIQID
ncbi:transglutaminase-like domain-containing protein [bacterium]|nr:transglutaminase-like domain-containing protein [bacterium]